MVVSARAVTTRCVAVKVKPSRRVFFVADDRRITLRVLFRLSPSRGMSARFQLGIQSIVVVLNQQVLFASDVEQLGVVFDARALGDEQGRLAWVRGWG